MKKSFKFSATIASMGLLLSGCATTYDNSFEPFQPEDLNGRINAGYLNQKHDNLLVIVDTSSSMSGDFDGQGFAGPSKFAVEKEFLSRLNKTIPDISLNSGLRTFGTGSCADFSFTKIIQDMGSHSSSSFASALDTMTCTGGGSPMHKGIEAASDDLASTSGSTAVLILSDGWRMDSTPIPAAKDLAAQYGNNVCIYGVWVGSEADKGGRYLLQQLSDTSGCGFVVAASEVSSASGMGNYVSRLLMSPATPTVTYAAVEGDADADGVADSNDSCPDTPAGAIVNKGGCWAFHGVFFDFDKATIKDKYNSMFENAVKVMNRNPGLTVRIEGYTDNIGSPAYNLDLSKRRADAVKARLVEMGIDPARMTTKGYGMADPIASNDTEEGRAENRRVYFSRTDR